MRNVRARATKIKSSTLNVTLLLRLSTLELKISVIVESIRTLFFV